MQLAPDRFLQGCGLSPGCGLTSGSPHLVNRLPVQRADKSARDVELGQRRDPLPHARHGLRQGQKLGAVQLRQLYGTSRDVSSR